MNAVDRGSTGARETSWFHQLLEGKSARPSKSSDSFTVLLVGGAGGADGSGASDDAGAIGVFGGSLPQPEASAHTNPSATVERIPLPGNQSTASNHIRSPGRCLCEREHLDRRDCADLS